MINVLFRTNFESTATGFIVFLGLNGLLAFILLLTGMEAGAAATADLGYGSITLWLLLIGLVSAVMCLLRHNRERRGRLYAQLSVTALQVRIAYWCHVALYCGISTLLLVLVMLFADRLPLSDALLYGLLFLCHAGVLMALLSIVSGNSLRLIPEEIRRRTIAYFFLATLIVFLFLLVLGYVISWYIYVLEGGYVLWGRLTVLMVLLCTALVAWDIWLFQRRESYLG